MLLTRVVPVGRVRFPAGSRALAGTLDSHADERARAAGSRARPMLARERRGPLLARERRGEPARGAWLTLPPLSSPPRAQHESASAPFEIASRARAPPAYACARRSLNPPPVARARETRRASARGMVHPASLLFSAPRAARVHERTIQARRQARAPPARARHRPLTPADGPLDARTRCERPPWPSPAWAVMGSDPGGMPGARSSRVRRSGVVWRLTVATGSS